MTGAVSVTQTAPHLLGTLPLYCYLNAPILQPALPLHPNLYTTLPPAAHKYGVLHVAAYMYMFCVVFTHVEDISAPS
jgi:hypothetical protein